MMTSFAAKLLMMSAGVMAADLQTNGWPSIQIKLDGQTKTVYGAKYPHMSGDTLTMPAASGTYLSETPYLDPNSFFTPNLLGATLEFDVNLSARNCGCVAAFYLVKMPGKHEDGSLWQDTDGYYYCDANKVDGNFCPEFDVMEANQWAFQTTPHKCDAPNSNGFYSWCDKVGDCGRNFRNLDYNTYGPGTQFKINSLEWFHVVLEFGNDDSEFQWFTTTLEQGSNWARIEGNCDSNKYLSNDLRNGMTFAITNWSTYDNWLWGDKCQAQACHEGDIFYSNISIKTAAYRLAQNPIQW